MKRIILFILLFTGFNFITFYLNAQNCFDHRGYLGWMVDFRRSPVIDKWPSIKMDSTVLNDYIETLDFLKRQGMNEITPWGLFTDENWEPEISKTVTPERKALIDKVIKAAHERNIKILCGLGVYSWGFGKIISLYPEVTCSNNPKVMDFSKPQAWEWQRKVFDYIINEFDFDGISMQSGDKGWCKCPEFENISAVKYHALLNQKAVQYIRSKKPAYIIGICSWGIDLRDPKDLDAIHEMTRNVDYLIDVGETAGFTGIEYRQKLIRAIIPCEYGNTAIPNIEPIQALHRDSYFIPTTFATCSQLKEIYKEGGRACEAYARTRGNSGDKVTIEVVTALLSDPSMDIEKELRKVIKDIYIPANDRVLSQLTDIYEQAESLFFHYIPTLNTCNQYDKVILLGSRDMSTNSIEYFNKMDKKSKADYVTSIKDLLEKTNKIKNEVENSEEMELLLRSISNMIVQLEK